MKTLKRQLALQLYTLREDTKQGFDAMLEQVAKLGYSGVEFAGFGDQSADEILVLLSKYNLFACSAHIGIDELETQTEQVLKYLKQIGCRNAVIPYATFQSQSDMDTLASRINALLPKVKAAGLNLVYHNHTAEFETLDGVRPIDILLRDTQVMLELDTFWALTAGEDVPAFMRTNRARISIIHLKDGTDGKPCAIGEGTAPCKRIYDLARELNISHIIVENDFPTPSGLEDIERSMRYISKNF